MFAVLERMGVSEQMITWVRYLYDRMVSRVQVNGCLTTEVRVRSCVRKGCPLPPVLFVCVIMPLLRVLTDGKLIRGLKVPGNGGRKLSVVGYMDDITVVCKNVFGLRRVKLMTDFCSVSVFCLKMEKNVRSSSGAEIQ